MTDVAAELARPSESDQRVEVGPVDIHLAARVMDCGADVGDVVLVDAVGGWVGNHQRCQLVGVFGHLGPQVVEVNVAVLTAAHHHDPHSDHGGGRRVGAVRAGRDQADVAIGLAAAGMVVTDGQQPGVLALRSGVGLQRDCVVAGDTGEPILQVGDQLAQAGRVLRRRERGRRPNSGQVIDSISAAALSFMVQEPNGIMVRSSARSLSASIRR